MKAQVASFVICLCLAVGMMPTVAKAYCVGWDKEVPNYDPDYYSVSHEFRRSKYVIRAKVIRETWLGEDAKPKPLKPPFQFHSPRPWGFDPYVGAYYDVKVEEALKGRPPAVLRLFSENSTSRFWLKPGSEWVLFVTDETFDELMGVQATANTCGNMQALPKGASVLRAARQLAELEH